MARILLRGTLMMALAACSDDSPTSLSADAAKNPGSATFDAGPVDAGHLDAGHVDATAPTQNCPISASSYDQSCQVASDCVNATSGNLCDGLCHGANFAINRREQPRHTDDVVRATAGQPELICHGPCEGSPSCESGSCKYRSCAESNN